MNGIGASILSVLGALVLFSPRRYAALWMVGGVLFLTQEQVVLIGGINVTAIRLLEVMAFLRVLARQERFSFCRVDALLFTLYGYTTLVFLLRSDQAQAYAIGMFVDTSLCYVVFRALIWDEEDVVFLLQRLPLLLIPYVGLLLVEVTARENPFGALGSKTWLVLREGRLRAMGSFRNPSLLGTLGAALLPMYISLYAAHRSRFLALTGMALCISIVVLANSGGPVSATAVGLLAWGCWRVRRRMSLIRRGLVATVLLLAVSMNAPVWYIFERISFLTGGSGWHRSHLLSMAYQDLDRWWLAGMNIQDTAEWFAYTLDANGGADITNAFLEFGLRAGLGALFLFITLLVITYKAISSAFDQLGDTPQTRPQTLLLWGLGSVTAVHITTWLGITYFDQTNVLWLMHLASIASCCTAIQQRATMPQQAGGARPWTDPGQAAPAAPQAS